jgi:hypothetical protein
MKPEMIAMARRVGLVVALLAGIDVVARLVVRFALPEGTDPFQAGAWALLAMVLAVGVVGFRWTRERRVPPVAGDLFWVVLATTLLVTLAGPFVSGSPAFDFGFLLSQFGLCAAMLAVGAGGGLLLAVALGLDPASRALKARAAKVKSKPRQPGARR